MMQPFKHYKSVVIFLILALTPICHKNDVSFADEALFKRSAQERLITNLDPSSYIQDSLHVSPDGKSVAYIAKVDGKQAVTVNGKAQGAYDEIRYYEGGGDIFSADSRRTSYYARSGSQWHVIIDGNEEKYHEPHVTYFGRPVFSLDGKRTAYVATDGKKQYMVIDGQAGPKYDVVSAPTFSSNGKRVAYSVIEGKKAFIIADDKKQKEYAIIGHPIFSPDGKRLSYKAHDNKALTERGQRWFMVIDGHEEKDYWRVWEDLNIFSADGIRVAYDAEPGDRRELHPLIVVDGQEVKDEVASYSCPVFSPDGSRLAYMARMKEGFFNVINGRPGKIYDEGTSLPVFSPDSLRVAYYGRSQGKYIMTIDGSEDKPYDNTGFPVFSPNSRRVAYAAKQGKNWFIVVDGIEQRQYDFVSTPSFSPDSKRVIYIGFLKGKQTVVVDGLEGRKYDKIFPRHWRPRVSHKGIGFQSDLQFYYFAQQGRDIVFVEQDITPF